MDVVDVTSSVPEAGEVLVVVDPGGTDVDVEATGALVVVVVVDVVVPAATVVVVEFGVVVVVVVVSVESAAPAGSVPVDTATMTTAHPIRPRIVDAREAARRLMAVPWCTTDPSTSPAAT
jgi:hypothetical protein